MKRLLCLLALCGAISAQGILRPILTNLSVSTGGGGSIALLTHTSAGCTSNSGITSSGINITGATLVVVISSAFSASTTITSSPSVGSMSSLTGKNSGGVFGDIRYIYSPSTSSSTTFTATGTNACIAVLAFSGTVGSTVDQQNSSFGLCGSACTSQQAGSVTPTANNEVVVSALGLRNTTIGIAVDSGFTLDDSIGSGGGNIGIGSAHLIQTTATAANPTWSWTTAQPAVSIIGTFK